MPAGGGKKKLKRREREALLQQHGIALQGQLKHQQDGAAGAPSPGRQGGNAGEQPQGGGAGPPPKPVDDDDDIFGDAGTDYEPTIKDEKKKAAAAAAVESGGQQRGGYFGGAAEDLHADLPPLPADGEERWEVGEGGAHLRLLPIPPFVVWDVRRSRGTASRCMSVCCGWAEVAWWARGVLPSMGSPRPALLAVVAVALPCVQAHALLCSQGCRHSFCGTLCFHIHMLSLPCLQMHRLHLRPRRASCLARLQVRSAPDIRCSVLMSSLPSIASEATFKIAL